MKLRPRNDAAPSGNGASVDQSNMSPESTFASLFLAPPARRNAPPGTSGVAANRIAGHARALRASVLAFIIAQGSHGATDDEGEVALRIKCSTYTPRRGELVALGLVRDSGRRRNTASGRPAAVWVPATLSTATPGDATTTEGGAA